MSKGYQPVGVFERIDRRISKFDWPEKLVVDRADSVWGVPRGTLWNAKAEVLENRLQVVCLGPLTKSRKGVPYARQLLKTFPIRNPACPTHVDATNPTEPICSVESGDSCHEIDRHNLVSKLFDSV